MAGGGMIYDEPVFRTLGDTAINVEFGDETSIPLNFRILALDFALREHAPKGLVETNPQVRTLGLVFDPLATTRERIVAHVKALIAAQGAVSTLPSRRVIIPALYDDPWSRECAEAFGVRNNIEYIAEFNGMTVAQVIETHTGCDYWVTGVGFVPGAFMSYAMEPARRFGAPLYRTPRTWTHARLLNFGGTTSTIYPIRVPGGGQLFGRTPIEIFDPRELSPAFADGPVLAKAGDRHRYEAIGREEYDAIRAEVEAGTYEYRVEDGTFDCAAYVDWLAESRRAGREARPREHVGAGLMLEVLEGGLRTTVQDMGRRGGQALGIPPSGAQDGFALRIANLLVGNPAGGPAGRARRPWRGRPRDHPRPAQAEGAGGLRGGAHRRRHGCCRGRRSGALLVELRPPPGPDPRLQPRAARRTRLPRGSRRKSTCRSTAAAALPMSAGASAGWRGGRSRAGDRLPVGAATGPVRRTRRAPAAIGPRAPLRAARAGTSRRRDPRRITSRPRASRRSTRPRGNSTRRRTGRACASSDLSLPSGRAGRAT